MAQEIYHRSNWGNPTETWGNSYLNADLTNELYKRASEYENSWVTDQLLNGVGTKPSIILTPTAYEDGVLNSVKPAKTFGSELVANGDFSDGTNDWTLNASALGYISTASQTLQYLSGHGDYAEVKQLNNSVVGKKYKGQFEVISKGTNANVYIQYGRTNIYSGNISDLDLGVHTFEVISSHPDGFSISVRTNGIIEIDNVSVKEVIDADFDFTRGSSATRVNEKGLVQDVQLLSGELVQNGDFEQIGSELVTNGGFDDGSGWSVGTNMSISNGKLISTGSNFGAQIKQTILENNKTYELTFDIVEGDYVSGNMGIVSVYYDKEVMFNTEGTHSVRFNSLNQTEFRLYSQNFIGSIDNVSVKEVGQNWTFGTGWSMGDGKAIFDTTSNSSFITNLNISSGNLYRLKIEGEVTSGNIKLSATSGLGNDQVISLPFEQEITHDGGANTVEIRTIGSAEGFISNVSVIEITDDTDLPRINYKDGEGSLLLEPQSTNLITYSEELTTNWTRSSISTPTDADVNAPDGASTVKRLQTTNSDGSIAFTYNTSFNQVSGTKYTVSVYAKSFDGTDQLFGLFGNGSGLSNAHSGNLTATSKWQRFTYTFTASNTSTIGICKGNDRLAFDILFWGFQIEALSYATSYIPTNGSTVTRLADVCNNSGNSDLINSTEGVLYAEISALADDGTFRSISLSNGTSTNRVSIRYNTTSNSISAYIYQGTTNVFSYNKIVSDVKDFHKVAIKYKSGDISFWVDGVEAATSSSSFSFLTLTDLSFLRGDNVRFFYGNVKCVAVFKEALSDTELQKLTTI